MRLSDIKFMYGTWSSNENTVNGVINALKLGFNAIDTAQVYGHYVDEYISAEAQVGQAINFLRNENYKINDIWIQTKYHYSWERENLDGNKTAIDKDIEDHFSMSQQRLGVAIDSYLLHGAFENSPSDKLSKNDILAWEKFEELYTQGKVKAIGVSNFNYEQIQELTMKAKIKPMILQNFYGIGKLNVGDYRDPNKVSEYNEIHNQQQDKILVFCHAHNIQYQSFNNKIAENKLDIVNDIAKKYDISQKQVVYSFEHQLGIVPITGTTNQEHLKENMDSLGYEFTNGEMLTLGANTILANDDL